MKPFLPFTIRKVNTKKNNIIGLAIILLAGFTIVLALTPPSNGSAQEPEKTGVEEETEYLTMRIQERSGEWLNHNQMYKHHCTKDGTGALVQMNRLTSLNNSARDQIRMLDMDVVMVDPDGYMGEWYVSRYYSPVPDQEHYYNMHYEEDFQVNCQGSCFHTASGLDLRTVKPFSVVACPPEFDIGQKFVIEGVGKVTCADRGGAIKNRRLDIWSGLGMEGLNNIMHTDNGGKRKVWKSE